MKSTTTSKEHTMKRAAATLAIVASLAGTAAGAASAQTSLPGGLHGNGFHGNGFHGNGFHGNGFHGNGFHGNGLKYYVFRSVNERLYK